MGINELTMINLIIITTILVVSISVMYFLFRWIFRVDSMMKESVKQTRYLRKIAELQGAKPDEINRIENTEIP